MNKILAELILYRSIQTDPAIEKLAEVFRVLNGASFREAMEMKPSLFKNIHEAASLIAQTAEQYGFTGNAWQQYLTYLFLNDENPFTLRAEGRKVKKSDTVSEFALHDMTVLKKLFAFDFSVFEKMLECRVFSKLAKYKPTGNRRNTDDPETGELIAKISGQIAEAADGKEVFSILSGVYKAFGVGTYGLHTAFRLVEDTSEDGSFRIVPVAVDKSICLDDLVGLALQKKMLVTNTKAFCKGKRANDVLLYGDNGTGKSTSVKAILNENAADGLRLVEVNKYQFRFLPELIAKLEGRYYRFIIFIDDLSFEENEIEYKFLKSVIEGGIENRPGNILIYATSNRRHLIKEMWDDRKDMEHSGEVHRSDTIEEKISLSSRFGVTINFSRPDKKGYEEIVLALAEKEGLKVDPEFLLAEADRWELRHGGFTGRVARQFINYMAGLE